MAKTVILQRSTSMGKVNGTIGLLYLKTIDLDIKIVILSALVQIFWSKMSLRIMVDNVTHLHMSQVQTAQSIFRFIKRA